MKKLTKGAALLSIVAAASLAFAGCSPAAPAETASPGTPRTLTFWNNATTGPGKAHWEALAKSFEEKHPGVTVRIQNIQNEDWDGKLQTALNSPDAPDVFMQRGGEKMVEMIRADLIQPVTDAVTPEIKTALGEAAFEGATYDGKIWAMTDLFQPGGMWYSEDLFKQAGITKLPETLPEFFETVKTLKAAGITPIALGAKDAWPAAHWYYWFALRECKTESLEKAATDRDFTDPCWLKAGQDLADLKALEPFQDGLLTTPAQQGAGSSAGLIANHKPPWSILPQIAFGLPMTIVILVPFLQAIPKEIEEAAAIDGCGRLSFFWRIALRLSVPGLVTTGILAFIGSWNGYMLPLFILNEPSLYTLPLGVQSFSTEHSVDTAAVLAFTSLSMLPALAFFSLFERRIVGGLTGAVKG